MFVYDNLRVKEYRVLMNFLSYLLPDEVKMIEWFLSQRVVDSLEKCRMIVLS